MGIFQLIYLAILMMGLGMNIAKNGEPKTGYYSAGWALVAVILEIALLYFGGFFG